MVRTVVIILNWNGWQDTFQCLRSLQNNTEGSDVWLVDNASREDKCEEARSLLPGLRVLRWDDNYGWAGGNNRALKIAANEGYSFAYLLNNDCETPPGFLARVAEAAQDNPKLAAVGSRVVYTEPAGLLLYDGEYHPAQSRTKPFAPAVGTKPVREVCGAGMLIRLQALEEVGYFDERFFCYHEETHWCWRAKARGWEIAIAQESVIRHRVEGSNENANSLYYRIRNLFLLNEFLQEQPPGAVPEATFNFDIVLGEAYSAYRGSNHERWQAAVNGMRDGMRGQYGKRPAESNAPVPSLLIHWWMMRLRLATKFHALHRAMKHRLAR